MRAWDQAKYDCQQWGGHLVIIRDDNAHNAMSGKMFATKQILFIIFYFYCYFIFALSLLLVMRGGGGRCGGIGVDNNNSSYIASAILREKGGLTALHITEEVDR